MAETEVDYTTISNIVTHLIKECDVLNRHLIAVYLFGSFSKGSSHEKSDIDLAFVLEESFYKQDSLEAVSETEMLSVKIADKIGKVIDVTVMNSVSLNFAYHTLRNSRCIYERSVSDRILYEIKLENEYQDFEPFIRELRASKRRALIGGD